MNNDDDDDITTEHLKCADNSFLIQASTVFVCIVSAFRDHSSANIYIVFMYACV